MKKRKVKQPYLIVVEDPAIENLIKHIKDIVNSSLAMTLKLSYGGSICDLLKITLHNNQARDYSQCYSIYDIDRLNNSDEENSKNLMALRQSLSKMTHEEIALEPLCVEGLLLEILGFKVPRTSKECKTAFADKVANKQDYKIDRRLLEQKFPVEVLKAARKKCSILDKLFQIFEPTINLSIQETSAGYETFVNETADQKIIAQN